MSKRLAYEVKQIPGRKSPHLWAIVRTADHQVIQTDREQEPIERLAHALNTGLWEEEIREAEETS